MRNDYRHLKLKPLFALRFFLRLSAHRLAVKPQTLLFCFTLFALFERVNWPQRAVVKNEKALQTHCALPVQHRLADKHSEQRSVNAAEHLDAEEIFSSRGKKKQKKRAISERMR